jgi:hypothetical protein
MKTGPSYMTYKDEEAGTAIYEKFIVHTLDL